MSKDEDTSNFCFSYDQFVLPNEMLSVWKSGLANFRGNFTISLVLSNVALSLLYSITFTPEERFGHLKKALEEETCTDTEILVGCLPNQVTVKCHRLMLIAGSEVFKSMFESGMKEAKENKITIAEMSEKGFRAMLAFLYYRGMETVYENGEVALELLQAAEKYGISDLKDEIREIILARKTSWFSVDVALELLLFVDKLCLQIDKDIGNEDKDTEMQNSEIMNVDENMLDKSTDFWESLKGKAVAVLKWYAKWKPKSVMDSEKYQEIFRENSKAGMEVGLCFLQM